jgi:hypothetical protein
VEHERTGFFHRTPIRRSLNRLALPNSFKNRIAKPMVHAVDSRKVRPMKMPARVPRTRRGTCLVSLGIYDRHLGSINTGVIPGHGEPPNYVA